VLADPRPDRYAAFLPSKYGSPGGHPLAGVQGAEPPGLAPGQSALWLLLRHEMRLIWRGSLFGGKHGWVLLLGFLVLLHAIGYGVALGISQVHLAPTDQLLGGTLALLFVGGLMLSQAVQRATELLDDRTDLSWLLSTPAPTRHILAVRLLAVAGSVSLYWLLFLVPLTDGMLFLGRTDLLGIFPMFVVLSLLVTSCGFAVTFLLLRLTGVRRTRGLANGFATLIGAAVFLGGQARSLLPHKIAERFWASFAPVDSASMQAWRWLPARALLGEAGPLVALLCLAIGAAAATSWGLQRWFAAGAQAVVAGGVGTSAALQADRRVFGTGTARALLRKEILLLRRYPGLAGLALYYTIYLVPAVVAIFRGGGAGNGADLLAAAPVLTAGELARLFVSVTMMGDEASELMQTAPVSRGSLRAAKLGAAALGVVAILAIPVIGLGASLPAAVPAMIAGIFGNVSCNLLLGLWRPAPIKRTDLRRDRRGWGGLVNVVGFFFSAAWSIATFQMLRHSSFALVPVLLCVGGLWLCRPAGAEDIDRAGSVAAGA
jgi:ABC-2 type transport system permease protein